MSTAASERTGTGLEFMQRVASGEIPGVPIGDTLGFHVVEAEFGRVVLFGRPDERSYNVIGSVHGGWAASILDSAMALSTLASLDEKQGFTTLDIKINYLRPITLDTGEVRAEGHVVHSGRRISLSEARLTDAAGKLLAHGTSTCLVFPR